MKCEYKEGWPEQHTNQCTDEAVKVIQISYNEFTVRLLFCQIHAERIMTTEWPRAKDITSSVEAYHAKDS